MITFTGTVVDLRKPTPGMITMLDIAHSLSMQCRYNGHIPTFYSVAEHSVRVAQQLYDWGHSNLTVVAGLLHDSAEAYTGDLTRPIKRLPSVGDPFCSIEAGIEEVIGEKYGLTLTPMDPVVKEADEAVYKWEVENIRTGKFSGWPNAFARGEFLNHYFTYGGNF